MQDRALKRTLGLTSAVMITVGSVIGSGIFLKHREIAQNLPSEAWIYGAWAALGVVCLFGAFAYSELGTMFPDAGGQYRFLYEGFGRFPAFLYGWCLLLVINTGTLAALAVAFASAVGQLRASLGDLPPGQPGLSDYQEVGVALAMIISLGFVNHFGVTFGAALQNLSTGAKLIALAGIVMAGIFVATPPSETSGPLAGFVPPDTWTGLVAACVALFWAYEGWHQLPFSAREMKNPERDLPRGLIVGMLILVLTYVLVTAVFLRVVPQGEMRGLATDVAVPELTMTRIFGPHGGNAFLLLLCLSVFGAANPNLLSTPRAFYAMAQDGLMHPLLTRVHATYRTPTVAIWLQVIWASILVIVLKAFRDITAFVVFAALIFYALTVAALFVLRKTSKDHPRPFRCPGYPWLPAIFILTVVWVDVQTLLDPDSRTNALYGLAIIASGALVYFLRPQRPPAAG